MLWECAISGCTDPCYNRNPVYLVAHIKIYYYVITSSWPRWHKCAFLNSAVSGFQSTVKGFFIGIVCGLLLFGIDSLFNSLWSSDTIWWHKSGSILAQIMACRLTALSHYLNQMLTNVCSGIHQTNFTSCYKLNLKHMFEDYTFKITTTSLRVQWVYWHWSNQHVQCQAIISIIFAAL